MVFLLRPVRICRTTINFNIRYSGIRRIVPLVPRTLETGLGQDPCWRQESPWPEVFDRRYADTIPGSCPQKGRDVSCTHAIHIKSAGKPHTGSPPAPPSFHTEEVNALGVCATSTATRISGRTSRLTSSACGENVLKPEPLEPQNTRSLQTATP